MTIHTIHIPPNGDLRAAQAIPEEKAGWAIFAPPLFLAYHKLWWALAIYTLVTLIAFALLSTPWGVAVLVLGGFPGLYLLLEGHQLRRNKLERAGWTFAGVAQGETADEALLRHLGHRDREELA